MLERMLIYNSLGLLKEARTLDGTDRTDQIVYIVLERAQKLIIHS